MRHPLLLLLTLKCALGFWLIHSEILDLAADEAQYWTWSQQLDWGYYSKPPGIAWQIAAGTSIWGNTPLGVRFGALLLGLAIPAAIYALCRSACLTEKACFWAALAFSVTPMGVLSGWLATTDGGMILFWTLACAVYVYALSSEQRIPYHLIGLLIGLGGLFKWSAFILWLPILLHHPWTRGGEHLKRGLVLSLIALLPSLYWNAYHDWATFQHVWGNIRGAPSGVPRPPGNPGEFFGAQAALYSPVFFFVLLWSLISAWRRRTAAPQAVLFCTWVTTSLLCVLFLLSFNQRIQGNWAVYAYPTSFVPLLWSLEDAWRRTRHLLLLGSVAAVSLVLGIAAIPYLQSSATRLLGWELPYRINPFVHHLGWSNLSKILVKHGYQAERDYSMGETYQDASLLSFYGPEQQRAYFLNLQGKRKNQFSYWPGVAEEHADRPGYFLVQRGVSEAKQYREQLSVYFGKVDYLGSEPLFLSYGKPVRQVSVFRCMQFLGQEPEDPERY